MTDPGHAAVVVVGVAEHDADATHLDRPVLKEVATALAELYQSHDAASCVQLIGHATLEQTKDAVTSLNDDPSTGVGLLVWTGHGTVDEDKDPWLRASDQEFLPEVLGKALTRTRLRRWVVVLDCCYGYSVGGPVYLALDKAAGRSDLDFAVVSSTDALDEADAGKFIGALAEVLRRGPDQQWWSRRQRLLDVDTVLMRLSHEVLAAPVDEKPKRRLGGGIGELIPNPLYRESSIAEGSIDEAHFLPKARGIEAGETGWHFTGRHEASSTLLSWVHGPQHGVFVVTGSEGTGKSALLGRMITLSVRDYRGEAPPEVFEEGPAPETGDVQLAFHARERRVEDLLGFLADGLDVVDIHDVSDLYEPLRTAVQERDNFRYVIIIDALDEAVTGHSRRMINEIVIRIAGDRGIRGVKVIIGTRPGRIDWPKTGVPGDHIYDLDHAANTHSDLTRYVARRLRSVPDSSYRNVPGDHLQAVAVAVADKSMRDGVGRFLVARVISKTLAASPPIDPGDRSALNALPDGLDAAFHMDLAAYGTRHDKQVERMVRDLLEGLAWDEGQGIPRRLIPPMAEAVTGRRYHDDHVTRLLQLAGGHITEVEQDGWALYRLYHEQFREHLRAVTLQREPPDTK